MTQTFSLPMSKRIAAGRWKPVKGYEEYYAVHESGLIISLRARNRYPTNRPLKPYRSERRGYKRNTVCLSKNGKCRFVNVGRIVAEAFIQNKKKYPQINHIDGNSLNNHVSNIEWCSQSQNNKHAYKLGLKKPMRGAANGNSKLTPAKVKRIRGMVKKGVSIKNIAKLMGIGRQSVSNIIHKKTWFYV